MHTTSRIQQIIEHERAVHRSLTSFAISISLIVVSLLVLVFRG